MIALNYIKYSQLKFTLRSLYTLALIKPDLYNQPKNVERVLDTINSRDDIKIVSKKEVYWSIDEAKSFYKEHDGKFFYDRLTSYMASAPFLALVLEGDQVITTWRKMIGNTRPDRAILSDPTTLRAHFGITDTRNSFHGSGKLIFLYHYNY
ncbi:nucleoside diphosphate kinase [Neoconidiobolus thromboides FSU 785]|nr:nucleoside diphosphate kinase [Neoconidiobolus thromboides FSU 785]